MLLLNSVKYLDIYRIISKTSRAYTKLSFKIVSLILEIYLIGQYLFGLFPRILKVGLPIFKVVLFSGLYGSSCCMISFFKLYLLNFAQFPDILINYKKNFKKIYTPETRFSEQTPAPFIFYPLPMLDLENEKFVKYSIQ